MTLPWRGPRAEGRLQTGRQGLHSQSQCTRALGPPGRGHPGVPQSPHRAQVGCRSILCWCYWQSCASLDSAASIISHQKRPGFMSAYTLAYMKGHTLIDATAQAELQSPLLPVDALLSHPWLCCIIYLCHDTEASLRRAEMQTRSSSCTTQRRSSRSKLNKLTLTSMLRLKSEKTATR